MLMSIAGVVAERSTCNRLHVGAVIARDSRVISMGYNGPPSGLPHCSHGNGGPCDEAVHAEANAVAFAARYGMSVDGATMYVTNSPCVTCAKLIINCGLSSVYFEVSYRDPAGVVLLTTAGVRCLKFKGGNDFEFWVGNGDS